ncbi:ABC transporter permease [Facklamia lactis]|uniref:ABC transporter permease n=1 Tax=Facklamia lactis TaxID=2749967 RepID=UPI001C554766|nr:ABC transporter permease subunit [Facklamia lactis]
MIKASNKIQKFLTALLIIFLIYFIFMAIINPITAVISESLWSKNGLNLNSIYKVLNSNRAMNAIKNSFVLAITLTITCNVLGLFMVLVTEYFEIKGAKFLRLGYLTSLLMGGLVMNFGYLLVYGKNGFITKLLVQLIPNWDSYWFEGYGAVLFVMTLGCTHIHMLFLRNAIRSIDFNLLEAAKILGSHPIQILFKVALPTILPVLLTLLIMTFQTGLGAFSAPVMIGGKDFQTISPLILTFANRPRSREIAALMSIFLGICQLILLYFLTRNEHKSQFLSVSKTKAKIQKQKITSPLLNTGIHFLAYLLLLLFLLPFIAIILSSFTKAEALRHFTLSFQQFTLQNYVNVLTNIKGYRPILTSIIYSALAAFSAVSLMTIVGRIIQNSSRKFWSFLLEYSFYIPWLIPSLLLALGYLFAYDSPTKLLFGHSVIGSWWILPLAYMVVSLPNSLRYIKASYYGVDNQLEDASKMLGASKIQTFTKIIIPILIPTLLALIAIQFNSLIDDYDLSVFLYRSSNPPLGIEIRKNANPDMNINAQAINAVYSVILMFIKGLALYCVYNSGSQQLNQKAGHL